jgi:predicted phosphodiesterase
VRVAALYDIHGNGPALEAVLADVAREGVETVVCGGDVVGGPFPAEALDLLARLPNVRYLRGNGDREVLEGTDGYGIDWEVERARLGPDRLAAVRSWPLTVELEVDGLGRVLFCHALPSSEDPIFTRITPDEDVVELVGRTDADVLVVGHTHVQFDRLLSTGVRVVNAGSVGMPYEGRRGAFWALLGPEIELRCTEYDVDSAAALVRESGAQGADDHARRLLEPPDPDEATSFFESARGP